MDPIASPAAPDKWPRLLRPLERFLRIEASSGIVLLVAALVALAWASSPWSASYHRLWHTRVFTESLHFWIDDGLMTIFFLVVGLEIRRELHEGELADAKRAALPVVAALGGMVAPALLYLALSSPAGRHGWGVPTATDIAFAVGVLALLGKRVAPALRVLLLALAIIDDIGAILLIAFFYSAGIVWAGLAVAAAGVGGVLLLQRLGVERPLAYVLPGAVLWLGLLLAGVHPSIAGVLLGLLTPVRFVGLQAALHGWVAFGIMPLFALANAGVPLDGLSLDADATAAVLGVTVGLVAGKPLGIFLATFAGVRLGLCALPRGVGWRELSVVGAVAGIGFTMAIFIAGLAFASTPPLLAAVKLGVLLASACAAAFGLLLGRLLLPPNPVAGAAATLEQAETSAEL